MHTGHGYCTWTVTEHWITVMVLKTFNFSNAIMAWWSRLTPHILHIWSPPVPPWGEREEKKDENNVGVSSPSNGGLQGKPGKDSATLKWIQGFASRVGSMGKLVKLQERFQAYPPFSPANVQKCLSCAGIFLVGAYLNWFYHWLGHQTQCLYVQPHVRDN